MDDGVYAVALIAIALALFLFLLDRISKLRTELKKSLLEVLGEKTAFLPPSHVIAMSMARGDSFWRKLLQRTRDKAQIASAIAKSGIRSDETVLLDSGTTVDRIPQLLALKKLDESGAEYKSNKVYTNNVLAALGTLHQPESLECILLSGQIDSQYGATYPPQNNFAELNSKASEIDVIVLSATALSFAHGPLVRKTDRPNKLFKRCLLTMALNNPKCRLVIACDWTKFLEPIGDFVPVLSPHTQQWQEILAREKTVVVTTQPWNLDYLDISYVRHAESEIALFESIPRKGSVILADDDK